MSVEGIDIDVATPYEQKLMRVIQSYHDLHASQHRLIVKLHEELAKQQEKNPNV